MIYHELRLLLCILSSLTFQVLTSLSCTNSMKYPIYRFRRCKPDLRSLYECIHALIHERHLTAIHSAGISPWGICVRSHAARRYVIAVPKFKAIMLAGLHTKETEGCHLRLRSDTAVLMTLTAVHQSELPRMPRHCSARCDLLSYPVNAFPYLSRPYLQTARKCDGHEFTVI